MANLSATLSTTQWLTLPQEVRLKLIEIFQIPRSGVGHINYTGKGPEITSDGHTYEDLKSIGVASMQQYLNSTEEDFFVLFNEVVAKISEVPKLSDINIKEGIKTYEAIAMGNETEPMTKERWTKVIQGLKTEAEEKGLLVEFRKILKHETIQKKS